jgi:riboflavin kinase/FMN adenylyltransferase
MPLPWLQRLEKPKVKSNLPTSFTAHPVKGSGRGTTKTVPTINVNLEDVPAIDDGVYAAYVTINNTHYKAAMHIGVRPTFNDTKSCEFHILDNEIHKVPEEISATVVAYIRPVQTFASAEDLKQAITDDIHKIHGILDEHEIAPQA